MRIADYRFFTYFALKTMPTRINPNFKREVLSEEETKEFLDEMFEELFDLAPISSDTDKVPDFRRFRDVA